MYQNLISNNSFLYYPQLPLFNPYYPFGLGHNYQRHNDGTNSSHCSSAHSNPFHFIDSRHLAPHSLYQHYPTSMSEQEKYFMSLWASINSDSINRQVYHQVGQAQAPFLELNSHNQTQDCDYDKPVQAQEIIGLDNKDKGVSNNTLNSIEESDMRTQCLTGMTPMTGMSINSLNYNIENKQLICRKRNRDKPIKTAKIEENKLKDKEKDGKSVTKGTKGKGKKTQKDRANELLEDSFLLLFDKKPKFKEENEEKEEGKVNECDRVNDGLNDKDNVYKGEEEDDENYIGTTTETDANMTKIMYYASNYQQTLNAIDFMKYNFNFELTAQYKTEKLITNFVDQHVIFTDNDNGFELGKDNGKAYNQKKVPNKVWSYREYSTLSQTDNQISDMIKEVHIKIPKINQEDILNTLKGHKYNLKDTIKTLTSTDSHS